ncbi:hypothetical protein EBS80_03130 [bacterium]|nr:hypothetical protein [bacterium]
MLNVYRQLDEQRGRIKDEYAAAKRWAGASRTHDRLSGASAVFSRLFEFPQQLFLGFLRGGLLRARGGEGFLRGTV